MGEGRWGGRWQKRGEKKNLCLILPNFNLTHIIKSKNFKCIDSHWYKRINNGKEKLFLVIQCQLKRCWKTHFGNPHSNNWLRQEWSINVKISGWKFNEKHDLHNFKYQSTRYSLIAKGKLVTLHLRNVVDSTLRDPSWHQS